MNVVIFCDIALCSPYVNQYSRVVLCSSEMSVHIWTTQCYIPEDGNINILIEFGVLMKLVKLIKNMFKWDIVKSV
jgi:hypothetical protein